MKLPAECLTVFDTSECPQCNSDCAPLCLHDFSSVIQRQPDDCEYADLFVVCSFQRRYNKKNKKTTTQNCSSGMPENVWQFVKATSIFKTKYWTSMPGKISKHIHFCHAKPLWTGEVHCFYLPMINFLWEQKDLFFPRVQYCRVLGEMFLHVLYWSKSVLSFILLCAAKLEHWVR